MKDIFIDNSVTNNFANPPDPEYKKLISWLMNFDASNVLGNAFLVVCNKLLMEYGRTSSLSKSPTNIWAIVDKLLREGRLNKIGNSEIREFKQKHFRPRVVRRLTCNNSDRDFIPVVLLSHRKYALTADSAFRNDLNIFPRFVVRAEGRPEDIPYDV
ncbi:MAG: hypothetical protein HYY80_05220 [Chloroflexi bacterium]|nr:hypothetical protein [Chloroflexota bacterium]